MNIKNIQDIVRPEGTVVFVTGVTGQDGSHMVDYLLRETNAHIIGGARRLSVENHFNIRHLENETRFQLVNFDLTDSHSIYKIMEVAKPDYFINFAAQSFVASSWDFARQTWECNSTAVLDCLEAIKRIKPDCRFYNAGSSEEFGNVSYSPQDENHPARPRSPYGASKSAARTLVKVYRESYGIYAVQGWLFNHEGPRRGEEFVTRKITKNVAKIFNAIVSNQPFEPLELGNVDAKRDWSDAEDMMDGVWRMLNQEKYLDETMRENWYKKNPQDKGHCIVGIDFTKGKFTPRDYVVGTGEQHTIREFVEKAFSMVNLHGTWVGTGTDEIYITEDGKILVKINPKYYRPAEVESLIANPTKIQNELGYYKRTSFEELIDKMVSNDLTLLNKVV